MFLLHANPTNHSRANQTRTHKPTGVIPTWTSSPQQQKAKTPTNQSDPNAALYQRSQCQRPGRSSRARPAAMPREEGEGGGWSVPVVDGDPGGDRRRDGGGGAQAWSLLASFLGFQIIINKGKLRGKIGKIERHRPLCCRLFSRRHHRPDRHTLHLFNRKYPPVCGLRPQQAVYRRPTSTSATYVSVRPCFTVTKCLPSAHWCVEGIIQGISGRSWTLVTRTACVHSTNNTRTLHSQVVWSTSPTEPGCWKRWRS